MQARFMFRVINTKTNEVEYIDDFYWFEEEGIRDIDDDGIARGIGGSYFINQSTGLKDKNGKLIYEGDIVKFTEVELDEDTKWETAEVVWGGNYDYPAFV